MGCGISKSDVAGTPEIVVKKDVPRENLIVTQRKNETIVRKTDEIGGNQFQADELTNCNIILMDIIDSITIDRCSDCKFAISSVRGSIFVRDCENCKFTVNCGQFRCRSCQNCDFFVHSKTGPVVESSTNINIGCGTFSYEGVLDHFSKTGIDPFTNAYYDVHDFTPGHGKINMKHGDTLDLNLCPKDLKKSHLALHHPDSDIFVKAKIHLDQWEKFVELTLSDKSVSFISAHKKGSFLELKFNQTNDDITEKIKSLNPC